MSVGINKKNGMLTSYVINKITAGICVGNMDFIVLNK